MEIRENQKICIIAPLCSKLDERKALKILDMILNESRQVGLDFSNIQECGIEFIEKMKTLNNKKVGVFNVPSDIFVLFNVMGFDKVVNIFVSELDFKENSRQLINRKFSVI